MRRLSFPPHTCNQILQYSHGSYYLTSRLQYKTSAHYVPVNKLSFCYCTCFNNSFCFMPQHCYDGARRMLLQHIHLMLVPLHHQYASYATFYIYLSCLLQTFGDRGLYLTFTLLHTFYHAFASSIILNLNIKHKIIQ